MHPNCSSLKDMMHNIPQKGDVNGKLILQGAILGILHIGTCIRRCEIQGIFYHLLILGGVVFPVIFVVKWNKELYHTIFLVDPSWASNFSQQSYDVLKIMGNNVSNANSPGYTFHVMKSIYT